MKRLIVLVAVLTALPLTALAAEVESREVIDALNSNMTFLAMCEPEALAPQDISAYLEVSVLLTKNGDITAEEWIGMTGALFSLIQQTSRAERAFPGAICDTVRKGGSLQKVRNLIAKLKSENR